MKQTGMNFQIYGYRTALTKIHFIIKSGAASLPEKAQDVNDLRHTDVVSSSGTERYWRWHA